MKKLIPFLFITVTAPVLAQLPVSQTPEKKNVVLEEFTGTACQYCPDGHKIGQQMKTANPKDVFLINVHEGSYAGSNSNFKTSFGTALAQQSGVSAVGYPSGTVNRKGSASDRGKWKSQATAVMGEDAYVNVA